MDEKLLLSICVPTYNRQNYLENLLKSIVEQEIKFSYEVIISDNDSTDDTKNIALSFCEKYANWIYLKNEINLGGMVNIRKCTEGVKGEFLLLVGDDDVFVTDAFSIIEKAINATRSAPVSAIFFNQKLAFDFNNGRKFKTGFEWLRRIKINEPAFLPCIIWNSAFWLNFDYYENMKLFFLPQLHCFIDACQKKEVYGFNQELVLKGREIDTSAKSYWFYKFHALVDCFEYPYLYDKVLRTRNPDFITRMAIALHETKLIKEIIKKIAFIKSNENDYSEYIPKLKTAYNNKFYRVILNLYIKFIFNSKQGAKLAKRLSS